MSLNELAATSLRSADHFRHRKLYVAGYNREHAGWDRSPPAHLPEGCRV